MLRLPERGPWRVRVVPNLYPAFGRHEVVVHSARHVRSLADLDDADAAIVADAWQRRRRAEPDGYLFAGVNEGREAGASLAHSHSQLVWLPGRPPAEREERDAGRALEGEPAAGRDGVVAVCPYAAGVPYELRIGPAATGEDDPWRSTTLAAALGLLAELLRRLRALEGAVPVNAWLHAGPPWHLHVRPRLTVPASLELGAGVDINPLPPEEAARRLRSAANGV